MVQCKQPNSLNMLYMSHPFEDKLNCYSCSYCNRKEECNKEEKQNIGFELKCSVCEEVLCTAGTGDNKVNEFRSLWEYYKNGKKVTNMNFICHKCEEKLKETCREEILEIPIGGLSRGRRTIIRKIRHLPEGEYDGTT